METLELKCTKSEIVYVMYKIRTDGGGGGL